MSCARCATQCSFHRGFTLEREAQRQRYLTHNNDPGDPAYRGFLSRLFDELRPHLAGGASGLDYGAGPGPALAAMMGEEGFSVRVYDPFFYPDTSALEARYDFITCTETAEHFSRPREDFDRLDALLKPSGRLGVMTGMLDDWEEFPDWHYRLDPTHISFYSGGDDAVDRRPLRLGRRASPADRDPVSEARGALIEVRESGGWG